MPTTKTTTKNRLEAAFDETKPKVHPAADPFQNLMPDTQNGIVRLGNFPPEKAGNVPRGNLSAAKETLKQHIKNALKSARQANLEKAEAVLRSSPEYTAGLVVHDYFANAPVGNSLLVRNVASPKDDVNEVIQEQGSDFKFLQLAVVDDFDPVITDGDPVAYQPVSPISESVAAARQNGVAVHVFGQICPKAYAELIPLLTAHPLLSQADGRELLNVFIDRVYSKRRDPNGVTIRSPLGALLGARIFVDEKSHVAEPLDGHRDTGYGPVGGLRGDLQLAPVPGSAGGYSQSQRLVLNTHGINTMRYWKGVSDVVVVSNRSLASGSGPWIHASTARYRASEMAMFHATTEHEILGAGKREKGPLDKVKGIMNAHLLNEISNGWLQPGSMTTVDAEKLVVNIDVTFVPVLPIPRVELVWKDHH